MQVVSTCMLSVSNSLRPHGLQPTSLLCSWNFPGKRTGVGCHFLIQGIFPTQGSNPHLLLWQAGSVPLSHQGSPRRDLETIDFLGESDLLSLCFEFLYLDAFNVNTEVCSDSNTGKLAFVSLVFLWYIFLHFLILVV